MPLGGEYSEAGGVDSLKGDTTPNGINGVATSPCSRSSSSEESDTELGSLCATVDASDSDEDSVAVDGSYSCFKGDEERLGRELLGVNTGI